MLNFHYLKLIKQHSQKIQFVLILFLLLILYGKNINPWNDQMFTFHDETQAARIQQFHLNINSGHIPPRIAPDFSFGMGYPMFNYYAPFPYWVATTTNILGFDEIQAIKLTILLALIVGFLGMYLFVKNYFGHLPGLIGAALYVSSPYIAVDIFVRGNLGELWIFALLPLCLYLIKTNSIKKIAITAITLSFLFTAHTILSLISLAIVIIYSLLSKDRRLHVISICLGLALGSYYIVPLIAEIGYVNAASIASLTEYKDHFLCLPQLWSSTWGFAGSAKGCDLDGMSFMLGKITITLGLIGLVITAFEIYQKKYDHQKLFLALITIGSIFLTLTISSFFWKIFESLMSVIQFPWRFLMFALFGLSFFGAYGLSKIPQKFQLISIGFLVLFTLIFNQKYFYGQYVSTSDYKKTYISTKYIKNSVAYKVAEYLPITADYKIWRSFEKKPNQIDTTSPVLASAKDSVLVVEHEPFRKLFMIKSSEAIRANIHYAPYWHIMVDYAPFIPTKFDTFGRPYIPVNNDGYTSVEIVYKQTPIEIVANILTVLCLASLIVYTIKNRLPTWNISVKKI